MDPGWYSYAGKLVMWVVGGALDPQEASCSAVYMDSYNRDSVTAFYAHIMAFECILFIKP